jgi:hypothetical protein
MSRGFGSGFGSNPPPSQTTALKEAVDDLEWPGAAVKVSIKRKPDMVSFASTGTEVGSLEVRVPHHRPRHPRGSQGVHET